MQGIHDYINTPVLTTKGIVDISDLFPGDKVIEYKTNKEITVLNTVKRNIHDIWRLTYTDGRYMDLSIVDHVFTGNHIMSLIDILKRDGNDFTNVNIFPVDFHREVHDPYLPDPYIAGALIMYGDYDDEYINLPLDRTAANNLFAHKYNLDYADKLEENKVYFAWNNSHKENPIRWEDFFPEYDFYTKSKQLNSPLFPREYTESDMKTRIQFIMGIFDVGYDKKKFPNIATIVHKHEFRLKEIQRLLWSMGVCSKIFYDPNIDKYREYKLQVLGRWTTFPGFFYDIDMIENFILRHNPFEKFNLKVEKCERITRGWTYNILLPRDHILYLDGNYLPRVSM